MTSTDGKEWADSPFQLLSTPRASLNGEPESPASRNASEMALVHNIVLRGLNSIYNQALHIPTPLTHSFMTYCTSWSLTLHSHHHIEETHYFPLLSLQSGNPSIQESNHLEHEAFLPGLFAFDLYISGIKDNSKPYSGEKLRELIDVFAPSLERHLHHEIAVLQDLARESPQVDWAYCGKMMAMWSKRSADRVREVPFLITNADVTYEGGIHGPRFPPFPWFVGFIFRWWYIPKMKDAWQFSSCDDYGVPRPLPFA